MYKKVPVVGACANSQINENWWHFVILTFVFHCQHKKVKNNIAIEEPFVTIILSGTMWPKMNTLRSVSQRQRDDVNP